MMLSYLESVIILPATVPGIKIGLSNLAVVFLLYRFGWKEALAVNTARILLSSVLFGSLPGFLFSLSGAILSFICMLIAKKVQGSSVVFVSMTGGLSHNIGQLFCAMIMFSKSILLYYLPVLLITGLITGAFNGVLSLAILRRVPDNRQL